MMVQESPEPPKQVLESRDKSLDPTHIYHVIYGPRPAVPFCMYIPQNVLLRLANCRHFHAS